MDIKVNRYIYNWLCKTNTRFVCLFGGGSSGKSFTLKQYIILERFLKEKDKVWAVLRKSTPYLKKSCWTQFVECFHQLKIPVKINKTDLTISYNGSTMWFIGLDDPQKLDSCELNYCFIEEASEFSQADFKKINKQCRRQTGTKNQVYLAFNPTNITSDVYKEFFLEKKPNFSDLHVTYRNNPFLQQDEVDEIESETDPYFRMVYTNGQWGNLSDATCVISGSDLLDCYDTPKDYSGGVDIGVDCARFGDDESVIYYKKGNVIQKPVILEKIRLTELVNKVAEIINDQINDFMIKKQEEGVPREKLDHKNLDILISVKVDVGGLGGGVVDGLIERYIDYSCVDIHEINFGGKAKNEDKYNNTATEMYFEVKDKLKSNNIRIYQDEMTITQLTLRTYGYDTRNRYQVTPKSKIKKKLKGASPDRADAFCLMMYNPNDINFFYII